MKLKQFQGILDSLDNDFFMPGDSNSKGPKLELEQYPTSPHMASLMLWNAENMFNDISGKVILDLGCGCGILGIGAIVLGAKYCYSADIDNNALKIAHLNSTEMELDDQMMFFKLDVRDLFKKMQEEKQKIEEKEGEEEQKIKEKELEEKIEKKEENRNKIEKKEENRNKIEKKEENRNKIEKIEEENRNKIEKIENKLEKLEIKDEKLNNNNNNEKEIPNNINQFKDLTSLSFSQLFEKIFLSKFPKVDTVLMNPPFGTKLNQGIDIEFVQIGLKFSNTVYSLHKSSTRKFLIQKAKSFGVDIKIVAELKWDLPNTFKFHQKKNVVIDVDFIQWKKSLK